MRWNEPYNKSNIINDPVIIPAYGVTDEERARWNAKQDALEYDAIPTAGSEKLVDSGSVRTAIDKVKQEVTELDQAYFDNVAGGLEETRQIATGAADAALASELAADASASSASTSATNASNSATLASGHATNASTYASQALSSKNAAASNKEDAEAWAVGTRNGTPVIPSDPTYHNNAKYYSETTNSVLDDDNVSESTTWSSDKLVDEIAQAISISFDSSTYELTVSIDNIAGDELDTASETIPISDTITDVVYHNLNRTLTFTYKDGTTKDVSIAAVITGLVSETRTIAGIALSSNITKAALLNALDVEDGANKTIVDNALSSDSTNPVQNKVVNAALATKSDSTHNHDTAYYKKAEIDTMFDGVTFTTSSGDIYINW